jgi:hypothetical protein
MAITNAQATQINNMNVASQRVGLGTVIQELQSGTATVPNATTSVAGIVKKSATQENSTATDITEIVTDFNALLAKLKAAGIMA